MASILDAPQPDRCTSSDCRDVAQATLTVLLKTLEQIQRGFDGVRDRAGKPLGLLRAVRLEHNISCKRNPCHIRRHQGSLGVFFCPRANRVVSRFPGQLGLSLFSLPLCAGLFLFVPNDAHVGSTNGAGTVFSSITLVLPILSGMPTTICTVGLS